MSMGRASKGRFRPASPDLLSEPAIVCGLAKVTLGTDSVKWDELLSDYDYMRDKIEQVIPGFAKFNTRIHEPGGFKLVNSAANGNGTPKAANLFDGCIIDLISAYHDGKEGVAKRFRIQSYDIPSGCVASYFPETNVLVSIDSVADKSNTPVSKLIPIRIRKA